MSILVTLSKRLKMRRMIRKACTGCCVRPVSVPLIAATDKAPRRITLTDPLLRREGDLRNRWQAVADAVLTMR
jgi:hypothetical protein